MPISVTCSECNSTYRVADEAAGKAIKCKKCGARVAVPAEGGAASADDDLSALGTASGGAADAGETKAKKKGGSGKIIGIIAGVLVLACCVCTGIGGGVTYYLYTAGKQAVVNIQKDLAKFQKDKGVVAVGPTVLDKSDTLTAKDPKVAHGKEAKVYKVNLDAGKRYVIDLKHTKENSGDPYLYLLDPKNKEVAHDDDGGGFPDAQIRYSPPVSGEYTIQATCLGGAPPSGMPFRLTVKLE